MSDDVTRHTDPDRYQITTDGAVAGFAQFVDVGGDRVFFHTVIDEEFGGRGLAGKVVAAALEATRAEGQRIVPVCPFVKGYLAKHPEWAEHVVEPTAEHFAAARAAG
jgi:predicted GNAT family acetyltransferase